ncbi:uncharacterized protein LOC123530694 [Mercenaria mercenaria]|uniref:uncharacterized protein LOC123530694 n=1 Tax=Mercenaria mercenaria TaxID=6596 RepID=UPI00234E54D1|nr:uncharacterized protein LOC123530694 [Mercenaria mercenaria]
MLRTLWFLGLVAVALVSGHNGDDTYTNSVQTAVKDRDVEDGTDAISRFLGFKCPKGYRCLPVLECLPCDYGTYKSNEGSDLCKNCPSGCTTLRKGAESWKECVPKCPPGYEESECGKTCTKCRAGYYKSNWKNKMCNKCPMNSIWNRNMVGMKKKSQCYQSTQPECHSYTGDVIIALDASARVSEEDFTRQLQAVNDFIEAFDVTEKADATRFAVLTFCTQVGEVIHFDHYANKTELQNEIDGLSWMGSDVSNISGALDFINYNMINSAGNRYDVQDTVIVVANGMSPSPSLTSSSAASLRAVVEKVFSVGIGNVNETEMNDIASNDAYTVIVDNTEELARRLPELTKDACELFKREPEDAVSTPEPTSMPTTQGAGNDRCYQQYGTCNVDEYENVRLKGLNGTNCQIFCHCAPASTMENGYVTFYWVEQLCSPGTLFDGSLPGCIHYYDVICTDTGPSTTPVTVFTTTAEATGTIGCTVNEACTKHDYDVRRLKPQFGSGCRKFCQCAHDEGSAGTDVTYYWEEHTCADGTFFDESLPTPVCNHDYLVDCGDGTTTTHTPSGPTNGSTNGSTSPTPVPTPSGDFCYDDYGTCTQDDHDNERLKALGGVDCSRYCHCAPSSTQSDGTTTYYWEEKVCSPGTIFVESLGGCDHANSNTCEDGTTTTTHTPSGSTNGSTSPTPVPTPSGDFCYDDYGTCTQDDHDNVRLQALGGVGCLTYCHCATASTQSDGTTTYYWEEKDCPLGTIFVESLGGCGHENSYTCEETGTTTTQAAP